MHVLGVLWINWHAWECWKKEKEKYFLENEKNYFLVCLSHRKRRAVFSLYYLEQQKDKGK